MENFIQNIIAISLGMMIFFSFVLAPMIFKILDAENAGKFVRKIFPYYYFVNLIFLSFAAILIFFISSLGIKFYITTLLVLSFIFAQFILMPLLFLGRKTFVLDTNKMPHYLTCLHCKQGKLERNSQ